MITREQVADLQPGDVVEMRDDRWPQGTLIRGPVYDSAAGPCVGGEWLYRDGRGSLADLFEHRTLTVVSRAPRPLYVNHPRTEPVPGDVVRDADVDSDRRTWTRNLPNLSHEWLSNGGHIYVPREKLPARLRLLVDGETGQVVQS